MLIAQGADLTIANKSKCNPSLTAEYAGYHDVADAIINSRDYHGRTPLFRLIEELGSNPSQERIKEIEDMVHDYIQCNAEVNMQVGDKTPLRLAIDNGYEDIAADLIKGGADPNDGNPLLLIAAEVCKCEWEPGSSRDNFLHRTAELLVQYGADVNASVEGQGTPIQMAVDASKQEFAMMLVESGARFDIDVFHRILVELQDPNITTERRGFIETMSDALIRSHSLDVSSPVTEDGPTPIELAIQGNEPDIALKLITAGCDVSIHDPLFSALDMVEAATNALKQGNHDDQEHDAVQKKLDSFIELCTVIISRRPLMDQLINGKSALDRAQKLGYLPLVKTMLENGADPNYQPYLIHALTEISQLKDGQHGAFDEQRYKFLEKTAIALLDSNASVNTTDEDDNSPLELAIIAVSEPIVSRLLPRVSKIAGGNTGQRMQRVNVDKKNKEGDAILIQVLKQMATALHEEDHHKYQFLKSVTLRLVEYGAEHSNALAIAVDAGHFSILEMFLEKEGDSIDVDVMVDVGNGQESTLLFKVLLELEQLVVQGVTNGDRYDFLSAVAKRFLEMRANTELWHNGRAMLDVAIACNSESVLEAFLATTTEPNMFDENDDTTALYRLMQIRKARLEGNDEDKEKAKSRDEYVQFVTSKLLEMHAELHVAARGQDQTLFDLALASRLWRVCEMVLEQSADHAFDDVGHVPFLHKVLTAIEKAEDEDDLRKLEAMALVLINRGCDVNKEFEGQNPLDLAIDIGCNAVIDALLEKKADYGQTILHTMLHALLRAQEEGNKGLARQRKENILTFIRQDADVDIESEGETPLTLSMDVQDDEITKKIMEKSSMLHLDSTFGQQFLERVLSELKEGVSDQRLSFMNVVALGLSDQSWPMMHEILHFVPSERVAVSMVTFLIDHEADPTQWNHNCHNETALHAAAERGWKGIATKLHQKGAEIDATNDRGETPLVRAVMKKQVGMIEWLISEGADVNAKCTGSACNVTPLHIASTNLDLKVVDILLKSTNINISAPGHWGRTPLHEALLQAESDSSDRNNIVTNLLTEGANPNAQDVNGTTPLMLAAKLGKTIFRKVVAAGQGSVDFTLRDTRGNTVYTYAIEGDSDSDDSNEKVYQYLERFHPPDSALQKRLMMDALKMNMMDIVETICERGGRYIVRAEPDLPTAVPISNQVAWEEPLWWAAYYGHAEIVEQMLNQGCGVQDAVDATGRNLYHWCSIWGLSCHSEVLKKLVNAAAFKDMSSKRANGLEVNTSNWTYTSVPGGGATPYETALGYGRTANVVLLGGDPMPAPPRAASFDDAIAICRDSGKPFCDIDFPPNLDSLVHHRFQGARKMHRFHNIEWCRPQEICNAMQLGQPRLDLSELVDPAPGPGANSWLIAAACATSEESHGIGHLFRQREYNEAGVYEICFKFGDAEVNILIDDRIPCVNKVPFFGGLAKNNNIAFMLLEKALAKLMGSYSGLTSGIVSNKFKESMLYDALKREALEDAVYSLVHTTGGVRTDEDKSTRVESMAEESIMYECLMLFQVSAVLGTSHLGREGLLTTAGMIASWPDFQQPKFEACNGEAISVLTGLGTMFCSPPCVAIKAMTKAKVTFKFEDARAARACRVVATTLDTGDAAAGSLDGSPAEWEGEPWKRMWRYAVPDHPFNFSCQLDPSQQPYVLFFDEPEAGVSLAFEMDSDKKLDVKQINELDGLEMSATNL
jgi:ankyrin repeat protein